MECASLDQTSNPLQSLSKHFNMSNINLKDLNITTEHIKAFLDYIAEKQKNSSSNWHQSKPSFPIDLFRNLSSFNRSTATGHRAYDELGDDDSITVQNINWISNIYSPSLSLSQQQPTDCDCYCDGMWRESLLEYKTIHGYIALVVSRRKPLSRSDGNSFRLWLNCRQTVET